MKSTLGKVVTAAKALNNIAQSPLDNGTAWAIYNLKKAMHGPVEFQTEQEMKIVEELGGEVDEGGKIKFEKAPEKMITFLQRRNELELMECEVKAKKVTISIKKLSRVAPADMEKLDDFIEWKE